MILILIIIMMIIIMMKMIIFVITVAVVVVVAAATAAVVVVLAAVRDCIHSPDCAAKCLQHSRLSGQGVYKSCATHRVLITCDTSGAYHVRHIGCLSRATHRVLITCNMPCATWYKGAVQLFSLAELKSHLLQLYFIG